MQSRTLGTDTSLIKTNATGFGTRKRSRQAPPRLPPVPCLPQPSLPPLPTSPKLPVQRRQSDGTVAVSAAPQACPGMAGHQLTTTNPARPRLALQPRQAGAQHPAPRRGKGERPLDFPSRVHELKSTAATFGPARRASAPGGKRLRGTPANAEPARRAALPSRAQHQGAGREISHLSQYACCGGNAPRKRRARGHGAKLRPEGSSADSPLLSCFGNPVGEIPHGTPRLHLCLFIRNRVLALGRSDICNEARQKGFFHFGSLIYNVKNVH